MKSNPVSRYLIQIAIASIICVVTPIFFDTALNGTFADFLYARLPGHLYAIIIDNIWFFAGVFYLFVILVISVCNVFRSAKLLRIAGESIIQDSEENKKSPVELREFNNRLREFKLRFSENEHARQLAEQQKNDLIVYLAHDLKTPLTSVIGYLSLLEEVPDMPTEQRSKYIGIAIDKAYRLEQLINEFFDITRLNLQSLNPQRSNVNLTILLMQIVGEFYPMFEEKGLSVATDFDSELILSADADKLARVFDNIFRNAASYSHPNTELKCSAHRVDSNVLVSVQNHSDDIPQEKLDRIFDKFYRADTARQSKTGGSGLGLAIAKQIVELHGGTISVKSTQGTTEFLITLPA